MESKIGARIADYLVIRGMSQRELAKLIGTTEASMSRYVKGARVPNAIMLGKIAKTLNVEAGELIGKDAELPAEEKNWIDADALMEWVKKKAKKAIEKKQSFDPVDFTAELFQVIERMKEV